MLNNIGNPDIKIFINKLNATLGQISTLPKRPKIFSCVFAANSSFGTLLSDLNNDSIKGSGLKFETIELDWFTKEQVYSLVEEYLNCENNKIVQFADNEVDLCFKITQGYPYFTQKLLAIMYDEKKNAADSKEFEKNIKAKFGKDFENTVKAWGKEKVNRRTFDNLKKLSAEAGDRLFDAGLRILEGYLKGQG